MMPTMPDDGALALDLSATVVGWAYGLLEWKQPQSGHWILPKTGGLGARYASFVNVFNDALEAWKPRNVYLERPLHPMAQRSKEAAEQTYAIYGFVIEACWRASVPTSGDDADTIRTNVIGRCRWPDDGLPGSPTKRAVVRFVRDAFGLDVTNDDEADAIVAWHDYRQTVLGIPSAKLPLLRTASQRAGRGI